MARPEDAVPLCTSAKAELDIDVVDEEVVPESSKLLPCIYRVKCAGRDDAGYLAAIRRRSHYGAIPPSGPDDGYQAIAMRREHPGRLGYDCRARLRVLIERQDPREPAIRGPTEPLIQCRGEADVPLVLQQVHAVFPYEGLERSDLDRSRAIVDEQDGPNRTDQRLHAVLDARVRMVGHDQGHYTA